MSKTREYINFIQWFQDEKTVIDQEEQNWKQKLEEEEAKLNKKADEAEQLMKMTEIVIDRSDRKQLYNRMADKINELMNIEQTNKKL